MIDLLNRIFGGFGAPAETQQVPHLEKNEMASIAKLEPKAKAGTVHWFNDCVERSQYGDFAEPVLITPGLANVLLQKNDCNRPLNTDAVAQYARDMINGRWAYNMETIIIAKDGSLNNGQHRLHAIIAANMPQKFLMAFGAERETRTTVDQGKGRTAGHYLSMVGVKNANVCAALTSLVKSYEDSGRTIKNISRHTHAEITSRVLADELVHEAAKFSMSVQSYAKGLVSVSRIGAAYYIFADICPADARDFLTQVCVGENIKRGDPAFAVRHALTQLENRSVNNQMELLFHGWNAMRQGRKLAHAKNNGALPALV